MPGTKWSRRGRARRPCRGGGVPRFNRRRNRRASSYPSGAGRSLRSLGYAPSARIAPCRASRWRLGLGHRPSGTASALVLYGARMGARPGGERPDRDERSPVAQLVEQAAVNRWVAGSSPARGASFGAAGAGGPEASARPRRRAPAGPRRLRPPASAAAGAPQPWVKASPSKRSRVAISSTGRRFSLVSCLTGRPKGMTAQTA